MSTIDAKFDEITQNLGYLAERLRSSGKIVVDDGAISEEELAKKLDLGIPDSGYTEVLPDEDGTFTIYTIAHYRRFDRDRKLIVDGYTFDYEFSVRLSPDDADYFALVAKGNIESETYKKIGISQSTLDLLEEIYESINTVTSHDGRLYTRIRKGNSIHFYVARDDERTSSGGYFWLADDDRFASFDLMDREIYFIRNNGPNQGEKRRSVNYSEANFIYSKFGLLYDWVIGFLESNK